MNNTSASKTSTPKKDAKDGLKRDQGVMEEPMLRQLLQAANR